MGRVTNPPHPMWVHFETFHENFQPTYASKYPPAQSLFLALGWKLFGYPWYGVWLSCGLMCTALCWMLQGWLPPRYALLGGLMAVAQWGIAGYWIDSYWGGAVAAGAGALVAGAVPRLARRANGGVAALAALGVIALANSRPYEGAVTAAGAAIALLIWRRRARRPFRELLAWRVAAPAGAILGCGLAAMLYYNYRVTGHPLLMPYALNQAQYGVAPIFWTMPLRTPLVHPVYRHEAIRKLWMEMDMAVYRRARTSPGRVLAAFCRMLPVFIAPLALAAGAIAAIARRTRKVRYLLAMLAVSIAGLLLERTSLPHYFAPAAGLVLALAMLGVQYMRVHWGGSALAIFAALFFIAAGFNVVRDPDPYANPLFSARRLSVIRRLESKGGKQVAIVRYAPDHNVLEEWVYNRADIDGSAIVWARDMGDAANRELADYYRGRKIWLVDADGAGLVRRWQAESPAPPEPR